MNTIKKQKNETECSLTNVQDWNTYYYGRDLKKLAMLKSPIDTFICGTKGKIFELGCGGSPNLARSALFGWDVGGIDFNSNGIELIKTYLSSTSVATELISNDIFSCDLDVVKEKYDLLISMGFLEHFKNPQQILIKWKHIVKDDGKIFTLIPNLYSVNACLMKKFDQELWLQHVCYTPFEMDEFHKAAGLVPLVAAHYSGRYDLHMLIPWDKICRKINNRTIFKTVKYFSSYVVENVLKLISDRNNKYFNSFITGVYQRE